MPIMAALFSHVTLMQIFLQKGWLNPLFGYVFISTARHSAISFLLAEYLRCDFNNHQAENYCLHFSSVEAALLIIMISFETMRLAPGVNTLYLLVVYGCQTASQHVVLIQNSVDVRSHCHGYL